MIIYILLSFCCLFCFLNFFFILFLSNALFRFLANLKDQIEPKKPRPKINSTNDQKGLVEVREGMTYDARFRNE